MITTNSANIATHKKIIATSVVIVMIIGWIIFSLIYIVSDKWQDYQLSQMQQAYQQGISKSVQTLMTESAKCNKIPLYYGDQIIEVVDTSCLSASKEESANKKPTAAKSPESTTEQPKATEKPNESTTEQPKATEKP